jgi:hypothetical protein
MTSCVVSSVDSGCAPRRPSASNAVSSGSKCPQWLPSSSHSANHVLRASLAPRTASSSSLRCKRAWTTTPDTMDAAVKGSIALCARSQTTRALGGMWCGCAYCGLGACWTERSPWNPPIYLVTINHPCGSAARKTRLDGVGLCILLLGGFGGQLEALGLESEEEYEETFF